MAGWMDWGKWEKVWRVVSTQQQYMSGVKIIESIGSGAGLILSRAAAAAAGWLIGEWPHCWIKAGKAQMRLGNA